MGYTAYDGFLAYIYGYCPYFGRDRARSANLYLSEVERISASTVLELGTADGSITIPFLKKGFIVDTVDFSDDMHQIVKEKLNNYHKEVLGQINFICSDITKFNTKKTYGAIMIPDSILTVIQKSDGVQHILQMCRDALDDKGILLLDIYISLLLTWLKIIFYETLLDLRMAIMIFMYLKWNIELMKANNFRQAHINTESV